MGARVTTRVAGVTFVDGYPGNVLRIEKLHAKSFLASPERRPTGLPVVLIRDPGNEHDSNAIEVHVPALGFRGGMIGHVPRSVAVWLAPRLDRGELWQAVVRAVLVSPENPDRPGVEIECWEVNEDGSL